MGSVLHIYHSSEKSDINEKKLHFKLLILKDKFMVKNADFVFSFNRLQARRFAKGYVLLYTLRIKSIGLWGEIRQWNDGTTVVQKTHDASKHHVQKVNDEA